MSTYTVTPAGRVGSSRPGHTAPAPGRPAAPRDVMAPRHALRLTRRGRVVVVIALLGLLLAVGFTLGRVSDGHAAGVGATHVVVVQPGETLWSIAARVAPHSDTRAVVARLVAMNQLHGASVQVGERLTVPS